MTEPEAPHAAPTPLGASAHASGGRKEVRLDPALHARLLAQLHEEQARALRRRALVNWALLPLALLALVIGTALAFSDDLLTASLANAVASGLGWILWRANRERIRDLLGL